MVEERDGVFLALSRSQELIAGARLKAFAIFLAMTVAIVLLAVGVGLIAVRTGLSLSGPRWTIGRLLTTIVLSLIGNSAWSTLQASLYVELREWKEGGSVETLEQVFA